MFQCVLAFADASHSMSHSLPISAHVCFFVLLTCVFCISSVRMWNWFSKIVLCCPPWAHVAKPRADILIEVSVACLLAMFLILCALALHLHLCACGASCAVHVRAWCARQLQLSIGWGMNTVRVLFVTSCIVLCSCSCTPRFPRSPIWRPKSVACTQGFVSGVGFWLSFLFGCRTSLGETNYGQGFPNWIQKETNPAPNRTWAGILWWFSIVFSQACRTSNGHRISWMSS